MKNNRIIRGSLALLAILLSFAPLHAQEGSYSLKQAVEYAIKTNINIRNAKIDQSSAAARVAEVKAIGLPQAHATVNYTNNPAVPRFFIPAKTFDPNAAEGEVVAAKFGVTHSASAAASLSQIIFDGSYLIGLKASQTYKELSTKNLQASKIQVAEAVTKAYYNVLVNDERIGLLQNNLSRLDSTYNETVQMNTQGFVEKLDVDRLEVQRNNLTTELENIMKLQEVATMLLKFQMGMDVDEPIKLTDQLSTTDVSQFVAANEELLSNYSLRVEYATLEVQEKLQMLDIRNISAGYLPSLTLNANYGYSSGTDIFSKFFTQPWFNQASIALNLNIPIWDSFSKKNKIIQSKNALEKIKQNQKLLQQSINLEVRQSQIQYSNLVRQLKERQRNLDLSKEIIRVTRIKYKEGVGSNIEVINAESSFKEAQTNYFTALYDLMIAKVDLSKAKGELYVESGQ
ncbi:TolC family protein [Dyadobacter pollutisoli]|uniref:TolC family protein n=1 Tax=Dyadobacter pollutisoli TaxID=2910158 RepID=A0A9E8N9X6_9BACT|nr:TolC family protein [Dyadobacter pollutisoli]WAC10587.1 TolC family protein [Dyadobacter pollutisoli]